MNHELIYSVQDSSEVDWDDLDEEIQTEITDLAATAFDDGIKADTPYLVREHVHSQLTENGIATDKEALELAGLGIDYSGPGRPSWIIVSPIPKSHVVRRLNPH